MADEYIRRDFALAGTELYKYGEMEIEAVSAEHIQRLPAADVEEIVHARWLDVYDDFTVAHCSNCGATFDVADEGKGTVIDWARFKKRYKGCPGCRALMDGGYER